MVFRKQPFAGELLLPSGDLEILESIRTELELRSGIRTHEDRDIIDLALRLLQKDLDSGAAGEVIEEVRREVLYRLWCTESSRAESSRIESSLAESIRAESCGARDNKNEIVGCEPLACASLPANPPGKNSI